MIDLLKTKKIIKRYLKLFKDHPVSLEDRESIEKRLDIIFPEDFNLISGYFNGYDPIGYIFLFSFDPKEVGWNILEETIKLREFVKLPMKYVALNNDESFITMLTKEDRLEETPVYWVGISDAYNLAEGKPLTDNPTIFPSFTDFFEYLVETEENKREEERKGTL